MIPPSPTWIEVDLGAIRSNFLGLRKLAGRARLIAIVKADAYGHGAARVSRALQEAGADLFGVASLDEAMELKRSGVRGDILILGPLLGREAEPAVREGFRVTAFSRDFAEELCRAGARCGKRAVVHAKVDTGMGRIGVGVEEAEGFVRWLAGEGNIELEGIFTHFASADCDEGFTREQLSIFQGLVGRLKAGGLRVPMVHAANSAGLLHFPESRFDAVRPGIALYGIAPCARPCPVALKPALSFRTTVAMLKAVPAGFSVSYGRTYKTSAPTVLATVPVGYRHGLPRLLSNQGQMIVRGKRVPIAGRVCMDQTVIDVGSVEGVKGGDRVTIYGEDGDERLGVGEVAEKAKTISYEILCALDKKVPRVYVSE